MLSLPLSPDAQDDFGECEYHDADEDDGGTRWHVEQITDVETGDAVYPSQDDACPYHLLVIVGEEVGGHLRNGEQTDGEHDAHHLQRSHDGHGDERHHQVFDGGNRQVLRTGEGAVECDVLDRAQEEGEEEGYDEGESAQQPQVCAVDGKDASEEEGGQVGHESWSQETADDAHAHSQGPEHGDGGILSHIFLA